jgi:hypothetical protein
MNVFVWFILSYGLMNIMVYGSIFQWLRDWARESANDLRRPSHYFGKFLNGILKCPMCFSFHGGWVLSLLVFSPTHELFHMKFLTSWFFDAILSSGAVWIINSIIEWFEENRLSNQKQEVIHITPEDEINNN